MDSLNPNIINIIKSYCDLQLLSKFSKFTKFNITNCELSDKFSDKIISIYLEPSIMNLNVSSNYFMPFHFIIDDLKNNKDLFSLFKNHTRENNEKKILDVFVMSFIKHIFKEKKSFINMDLHSSIFIEVAFVLYH